MYRDQIVKSKPHPYPVLGRGMNYNLTFQGGGKAIYMTLILNLKTEYNQR